MKILIYGAGAVGRGYLAPIFSKLGYEIFFVDKNPRIIDKMKSRPSHSYTTAFSEKGKYETIKVKYSEAFFPGEEDKMLKSKSFDFVFSCVGVNNFHEFAKKLKNVPAVISFENDSDTVEKFKKLSGNKNCFFGIPDIIASNTACPSLLKRDPLCLISEKGELAIEKGNFKLPKQIPVYSKEELKKYWNCKFYLHNTPHAAAAFLGKLKGVEYLHEAMKIPFIEYVVSSVTNSIKKAMCIKKMADRDFIEFYSRKELVRFKDELLFDPISRVGREPLRKLRQNDRLIQAAKFLEETGQNTAAICMVIKAVLYDALKNYNKELGELGIAPTEKEILARLSNLGETSPLFEKITNANMFEIIPPQMSASISILTPQA